MLATERKALREAFHNVVESLSALYIFRETLPNSEKGREFEANQGPETSLGALTLDTGLVLWLARG